MNIVALITGASSGIGEATARRLAREFDVELVLVARREERLCQLAQSLPARATWVAADLTHPDAPSRVSAHLSGYHDERLTLLANNAGASWRATFAEGGYANIRRTMQLNFDSVVRLTEALPPMLRARAPRAIVNVASTAAGVARPGAGAYSASKFALAGWTDALHLEERPHGVRVGPGFIATEGFPAQELQDRRRTRWTVSDADTAAAATMDAGLRGRTGRYAPRPYRAIAAARVLAPGPLRRTQASAAGSLMTTRTNPDAGP